MKERVCPVTGRFTVTQKSRVSKKKAVLPGGKGPSLKSEGQKGTDYCNSTMLKTSSTTESNNKKKKLMQ